ncbi:MAG: hypothetical protein H7281_09345, partial [Bacteriovorax sp.]|nr:hypothetical protein [Bacteriovorax sp.]
MLKLLYKTLLISVMSGSLMTINMTAFAQETTGSATAQMSKSSESNVTRDKNGVLKKTETHKFDGVESADMLASITMLATGTIAGRMLVSYRPVTNDVMIAAVGGLAFMAGEVISNVKFKKTIEDMSVEITKTNDGKKDQAQIDRLQDLKQSYEEAKKTTGTKKTMQLAAAAAFAGAAAFASYMAYQEYTLAANCKTALTASTETLNVCIKAGLTAAAAVPVGTLLVKEGLACGTCQAQLAPFSIYMKSIEAQRVSPGPSALESSQITPEQTTALLPKCVAETASGAVIAPKAGSAVNMACGAALKSEMLHQVFSYKPNASLFSDNGNSLINKILFGSQIPVVSYEQMQSKNLSGFEKISYQVLNLFLPEAEASWLPLLGLGVATTASYVLISGTLATTVDMQMFVPLNRAIAFGTLAGLSFLASKASQDQMDKLDANIVKIDQILKDMDTLQNGIKTNNVNEQQIKLAAFQANQAQEIPLNPNPAVKSDCASSMGSSNCKPLANQVANMPGFSDLPDSF